MSDNLNELKITKKGSNNVLPFPIISYPFSGAVPINIGIKSVTEII